MDEVDLITLILLEEDEDEEHLLKQRLLQKRFMLVLVDANYKFVVLDVGSYGKEGVFSARPSIANTSKVLPHVIIGDEAFRLHINIMKPFNKAAAASDRTKTIFNYRLNRARRVSENAFGLLSQRKKELLHYEYDPNENETNIFQNLTRAGGFQNAEGFRIRDEFLNLFIQEGAVEWQNNQISKIK
ncbi:hypothetical protein NQ314_010366 [Rhamnusium bicolor]|uniref:DDE Tnp4 domain-containing protein n=1 Tax=Rhamnusium bicolor TaxID=1586634 RepID=A0AAV8XRK5_9CUCU|nr:hypothetical protein NQ314_010366 [Rhamnusium bicolor]